MLLVGSRILYRLDDCNARAQTRPDPGRPAQQIKEKLEEMVVMASALRIQKTADGIIAARNAAARLCKLCSFIATGVYAPGNQNLHVTCTFHCCCKSNISDKRVGSRARNTG